MLFVNRLVDFVWLLVDHMLCCSCMLIIHCQCCSRRLSHNWLMLVLHMCIDLLLDMDILYIVLLLNTLYCPFLLNNTILMYWYMHNLLNCHRVLLWFHHNPYIYSCLLMVLYSLVYNWYILIRVIIFLIMLYFLVLHIDIVYVLLGIRIPFDLFLLLSHLDRLYMNMFVYQTHLFHRMILILILLFHILLLFAFVRSFFL
mmetsp:Transcript_576/g.971  ORF Transcript_576/g.971 Transcript_576/m.971 type:complete len:200 (+) Transcript_576:2469-3068(+)